MTNGLADKRDHKVDAGGKQLTAEELSCVSRVYAADYIVHRIDEGFNAQYVVLWYGYTAADDAVKLLEHISDYFITCSWRCVNENFVKQRRRGGALVKQKKEGTQI